MFIIKWTFYKSHGNHCVEKLIEGNNAMWKKNTELLMCKICLHKTAATDYKTPKKKSIAAKKKEKKA